MALKGLKVIEMAGLAPAPFCGMLLADFGARVIRVDRARASDNENRLSRGKTSIAVDLKQTEGSGIIRRLCSNADVLIEPYRPGVMERLGLGPSELLRENPRLIYARLTGYGQSGPLAKRAGHDINYLAISGLLSRLGERGRKPIPPINLLADFAGGGLLCAFGILMAIIERTTSGKGQVIDANMVEGAAYVGSFVYQMLNSPIFTKSRGEGWLDSGAPFYNTYRTKDGKYVAVGAIESQFYAKLLKGLDLTSEQAEQFGEWDKVSQTLAEKFSTKTRSEWCKVFDEVDACVTPVLEMGEATEYPHNVQRGTFSNVNVGGGEDDRKVPNPAPGLSRTHGYTDNRSPDVGEQTVAILRESGYGEEEIRGFIDGGVVDVAPSSKL